MPFKFNDPTQTSPEIHVGDVGTNFVVILYDPNSELVDLSGATDITVRFRNPSGESADKEAELFSDGTDGKILYVLEDGDIDISGTWSYQVIVTTVTGLWHTNIVNFTVYPNIAEPVL